MAQPKKIAAKVRKYRNVRGPDVKSMLNRYGLKAVNKPQRLNDSTDKSHHVLARYKEGGATKYKHIKFGQEGVKTNQTPEQREAFKDRHTSNIARGPKSWSLLGKSHQMVTI